MIAWFARNDVAANLLMATILVAGLVSALNFIPLEVFPGFESDLVRVQIVLPGAGPEEIEEAVAVKVEESLSGVSGIKRVTSFSTEGGASITIEADDYKDPREMLEDIKAHVDAISTFPADAENPVVELLEFHVEVITVIVAGDISEPELHELAERVRSDLIRIDGINSLEITGVRDYEISIEVAQDNLRQYDLTLAEIALAVAGSSLDLSAGNIRTSGGDVLIRSLGQSYRRDDFERIVIRTFDDGSFLRVGDVANVIDGFEESNLKVRFNGLPAATIEIERSSAGSVIKLAKQVQEYIKEQNNSLPSGVVLATWDDNSKIVESRLNTLVRNALQGGILVILLLSLMLRPTVALPVLLGIPVSFAGTLLVMSTFGITINIVSLFAFILVLGVVVDDAIITGRKYLQTFAGQCDQPRCGHQRHQRSIGASHIRGVDDSGSVFSNFICRR